MLTAATGALIGGLGSGVLNALGSIGGSLMSNSANRHLAEYQYQKDIEMWNRNNQYNSPAAQMLRLKNAGLNPNMVYGTGSVVGNTTTQMPHYQAPRMNYDINPGLNLGDALAMYADTKVKSAQADNLVEQKNLISAQAANELVKGAGMLTANKHSALNYSIAKQLEKNSLQAAAANLRKITAETKASLANTDLTKYRLDKTEPENYRKLKISNDLDERLKEYGLSSGTGGLLGAPLNILTNFFDQAVNTFTPDSFRKPIKINWPTNR